MTQNDGSDREKRDSKKGNTIPSSNLTKTDRIQCKHWVFTLNNYTELEMDQMVLNFNLFCNKYIYGKEVGQNNTPHLQGYLELKKKERLSGLKTKFGNRFHFEKMKGTPEQAVKYCIKDNDYVKYGNFPEYFFNNDDNDDDDLIIINKNDFYSWQKFCFNYITNNTIDERNIYWFYDEIGNVGKSAFTKFCLVNFNCLLIEKGKHSDIINSAWNFLNPKKSSERKKLKLIICDIPRNVGNKISTSAIESLKNGIIINTKYETGQCVINSPKIIIFSNSPPICEDLSLDRWKIFNLKRNIDDVICIEENVNNFIIKNNQNIDDLEIIINFDNND